MTTIDEAVHADPATASAERLSFFSDAVVAIAITLLALNLPVPDGRNTAEFLRDLGRHANDYIAFMISFAVIGSHWFVHHRIFGYVTRLGGWLARWNMLWLLTIVLTPFATRVIVADGAFGARFTFYAVIQALATGFFLLSVVEMDRHKLVRADLGRRVFTRSYRRLSAMVAAFLVSIPLAFVTRWAFACWVVIPFLARAWGLLRFGRGSSGPPAGVSQPG